MDTLIRIFTSRKMVISDSSDTSPALPSPLMVLPAEIIHQILTFLPPFSLVSLTRTCKLLRAHALEDSLWSRFVRENVPHQPNLDCHPAQSWRQLYISLHPYWFLARNKIWFSDKAHSGGTMTGNLAIIRYDPRRQCIEGLRLVAKHGIHSFESWDWKPEVIIHTFNPYVELYVDDPLVKIDPGCYAQHNSAKEEVMMNTGYSRGVKSMISLCHGLSPDLQSNAMAYGHLGPFQPGRGCATRAGIFSGGKDTDQVHCRMRVKTPFGYANGSSLVVWALRLGFTLEKMS